MKWLKDLFTPAPQPKMSQIDWGKVTTVEDTILVLSVIFPKVNFRADGKIHEKLKHLTKDNEDEQK